MNEYTRRVRAEYKQKILAEQLEKPTICPLIFFNTYKPWWCDGTEYDGSDACNRPISDCWHDVRADLYVAGCPLSTHGLDSVSGDRP